MTVILIICSYREQEFVRVGYYVNNEYTEEIDPENPPRPVDLSKLQRNILADKPRVTRFAIEWGGAAGAMSTDGVVAEGIEGMEEPEEGDEIDEDEEEEEEDDDEEEEDGIEEAEEDPSTAMDLASPIKQPHSFSAMTSPMGSG